MIIGIVTQAAFTGTSSGSDPVTQVHQTIHVPTISQTWTRILSDEHPRRTWRQDGFVLGVPFRGITSVALRETLPEFVPGPTTVLTGDPVLFQMTDAEAHELSTGTMPRNVALRAQRALAATNQVLIGSGAPVERPTAAEVRTALLPKVHGVHHGLGTTVEERLKATISQYNDMIEARQYGALLTDTPNSARARGAGSLLNRADWLTKSKTPVEPTPDPTPAEPTPVVVLPTATDEPESPSGKVKPGDRLTANDGQTYIARRVDSDERDLSDVDMFRRAARGGMNIFLFGEPGTGKTRGLQAAFEDAVIVPITSDTEVADLVGSYQPSGPDSFTWVNGPLLRAMLEGKHFVADEIGLMDPKCAAVLYPLMDGRRELMVTANPMIGTVHAKDGFSISGTTNPNAPGVRLSEALLSRFHVQIEVGTDYTVARMLGVNERLCQAAEHLAKQYENQEIGWCPQMRELLVARDHEKAFGLVFALRNLIASCPEMEREVIETQLRERFGDLPGAVKKIRSLKVD